MCLLLRHYLGGLTGDRKCNQDEGAVGEFHKAHKCAQLHVAWSS